MRQFTGSIRLSQWISGVGMSAVVGVLAGLATTMNLAADQVQAEPKSHAAVKVSATPVRDAEFDALEEKCAACIAWIESATTDTSASVPVVLSPWKTIEPPSL
jgi:hypothetical protein